MCSGTDYGKISKSTPCASRRSFCSVHSPSPNTNLTTAPALCTKPLQVFAHLQLAEGRIHTPEPATQGLTSQAWAPSHIPRLASPLELIAPHPQELGGALASGDKGFGEAYSLTASR